MIVSLTQGSIYQDGVGAVGPSNSAFFATFPSLEFDSFVAQGSTSSTGTFGPPNVVGGAVNLGGASTAVFTTSAINLAWSPRAGTPVSDQSNFLVSRLTLSNDAEGTISYLASADGEICEFPGFISGGEVTVVPEPGAFLSLLCLSSALAFIQWSRRTL